MTDREAIAREVEDEVAAFHDFIAAWFRGDVERSDPRFDEAVTTRWAEDLINVQPSGAAHPGREILEKIRREFGSNPRFEISIHDVQVIDAETIGERRRVLATYVERQSGARQSVPPRNDRRSSVWMERAAPDAPWLWRHLHETAIR